MVAVTTAQLRKEKELLIKVWKREKLVKDERVLNAFKAVPREKFVLNEYLDSAYDDRALPIGKNQTISQPSTVMIMLDRLQLEPGMRILEVGAGSGYNAALMGKLVGARGKVYTTEVRKELAEFARKNLKSAGSKNVKVLYRDGSDGYRTGAPYDRIVLTAAATSVYPVWNKQLKEGGIFLAPIGEPHIQELMIGRKIKGKLILKDIGEFMFVPLVHKRKGKDRWTFYD